MVALKHFFFVESRLNTMLLWEIYSFEEVTKRVAKAAIILVLYVNYCFVLLETLAIAASHVFQAAHT